MVRPLLLQPYITGYRVMFPIQDINHRVIGFGGRVMGEAKPKYLNSPETVIFDKSRNLYGLNFARTSRQDHIILCEGYMDVIAMHQAGFNQASASQGTVPKFIMQPPLFVKDGHPGLPDQIIPIAFGTQILHQSD